MDRKTRNEVLASLCQEAWYHAIAGQKLLSHVRDLESQFRAIDAIADKKELENESRT
jgi:hypothetical protein